MSTSETPTGSVTAFQYDSTQRATLLLASGAKRHYAYNAANWITTMLQGTALTTYQYDTNGNWTGTTPTSFKYVGTLGYYQDSSTRDYV